MKDKMLRDRFVISIHNTKVSETLQMYADLTLDKAKKVVQQKEAVKEQTKQLHTQERGRYQKSYSKNAHNCNTRQTQRYQR